MPTNVFFSPKVITEQDLYEDIIIESLKIYGQDVLYMPRKLATRDFILGESVEDKFELAYTIEAYIENTEGFEGEGNILSKFGLEIRDEATFIISRRQWDRLVGFYDYGGNGRPMEGDLIYLPLSRSFFEISFVEHEQPFYQLSNLVVWKLQCRLFEYNEEDFSTGIEEIDAIESQAGYKQIITVSDLIGTFEVGQDVTQVVREELNDTPAVSVIGKLVRFDGTLMELVDLRSTDGQYREFIVSSTNRLTNADATATAEVTEVFGLESDVDQTFANDLGATNYIIEQEADSIIDFSEANPFGEPGEVVFAAETITTYTMDDDSVTLDDGTIFMDNQ